MIAMAWVSLVICAAWEAFGIYGAVRHANKETLRNCIIIALCATVPYALSFMVILGGAA